MAKYVVSTTMSDPGWTNSTVLTGDPAERARALKAEAGKDIVLTGSISLAHTLIAAGVVDEYRLLVYPTVQGRGRRLFPDGTSIPALTLAEPPKSFPSGITLLRYVALNRIGNLPQWARGYRASGSAEAVGCGSRRDGSRTAGPQLVEPAARAASDADRCSATYRLPADSPVPAALHGARRQHAHRLSHHGCLLDRINDPAGRTRRYASRAVPPAPAGCHRLDLPCLRHRGIGSARAGSYRRRRRHLRRRCRTVDRLDRGRLHVGGIRCPLVRRTAAVTSKSGQLYY